jgi:hypothetical protein
MPTYTINGKKVTTEQALTEDQIDEIASEIGTSKRSLVEEAVIGAKKGISNAPSALTAGSAAATGTFAGAFPQIDELEGVTSDVVRKKLVGDTPEAASTAGRYTQATAEAVFDPLSYFGLTGGPMMKATQAGLTGAGATAGGDLGAATQKAITGEEGIIGRIFGSLVGGTTAARASQAVGAGGSTVVGTGKQLLDKRKAIVEGAGAAETEIAQGSAKRLLEAAAKSQGADNIEALLDDVQKASQYVTKADAPLLVGAVDNPVLRAEAIKLAKSNPAYRQKLDEELKRIAAAIDAKKESVFGTRYTLIPASQSIVVENAAKRIRAIDNQIEQRANAITKTAGKTDTGVAVENLIEAKKNAVKAELSPRYQALADQARDEKIVMPPEATKELFDFVEANNIMDIFGRNSKAERDIMRLLKPVDKAVDNVDPNIAALERAAGIAPSTTREFGQMTFDNVDSLKKAINTQLRSTKDAAQVQKLQQLKEHLNTVRETHLKPEFNTALKELDGLYYEKLGVPFSAQGVKDIDAKKYASQVAPVILKNKQAYTDFIAVAGDKGKQIASDALLSKAYDDIIKDGVVSPKAVSTFLKKNEEILEQLPDVKKTLQEAAFDTTKLMQRKVKLEKAYELAQKRVADNWITKTEYPDYAAITTQFLNSGQSRAKIMKDIKDLAPETADAVRQNIRSEVVNRALANPSGAIAFLENPANKAAIDAAMGTGYQEALRKIGKLSDNLKKADISKLSIEMDRSSVDALGKIVPGLDIPYVTSTLRDRISSNVQKAVRLISRVNTTQLDKAYQEQVLKLLTDPNGVKNLANVATDLDFSIKTPEQAKKFLKGMITSLPATAYTSLQTGNEPAE